MRQRPSTAAVNDYRIVPYSPDLRPAVAELFKRLWTRRIEDNLRYLDWRYLDNPYGASPLLAVALHGDVAVAVRGAYLTRWRIGDGERAIAIPCAGDTVVNRRHEGRNLVQRLTRHLLAQFEARDYPYVFNLSPGKLVRRISDRTGWRSIGTWPTMTLRRDSATGSSADTPHGPPTPPFRDFDDAAGERDTAADPDIRAAPPDPILLAASARRSPSTAAIGLDRDAAFYRWRLANPLNDYRVLYHGRDGDTRGHLILSATRLHPKRGVAIVDLAGRGAIQAALIREAVGRGRFGLLRMWWTRLPREVMRTVRETGFGASDAGGVGPTVLVRPVSDPPASDWTLGGIELLDLRNWEIGMFNSDIY